MPLPVELEPELVLEFGLLGLDPGIDAREQLLPLAVEGGHPLLDGGYLLVLLLDAAFRLPFYLLEQAALRRRQQDGTRFDGLPGRGEDTSESIESAREHERAHQVDDERHGYAPILRPHLPGFRSGDDAAGLGHRVDVEKDILLVFLGDAGILVEDEVAARRQF